MRQEPNYLYLLIGLFTAIVLVTSASPLSLPGIAGGLTVILSLLMTAYTLTKRRRQLLLMVLLGALAFLPATWFSIHPEARTTYVALDIYTVNLVVWLLFTCHIGLMIFRGLMTAQRIRSNEIYGAISVYLLIGVLFTEAYLLLLVWQPGALYFDPSRFPEPEMIGGRLYIRGPGDVLYYSFVTLGTVGYGDVTPSSPVARSLSLIEAVSGIMYVATMIARFVAIQIGDNRDAEP